MIRTAVHALVHGAGWAIGVILVVHLADQVDALEERVQALERGWK